MGFLGVDVGGRVMGRLPVRQESGTL